MTWLCFLHLSRLHRHSKDAHVSHFSSNFKLSSSRWALNSSSSEAGSLLVRRPRAILPSRSCCSSCASCSTTSALVSRLLILSVAMVCHFGRDEERQFACAVPKWCENRVFPTKNAGKAQMALVSIRSPWRSVLQGLTFTLILDDLMDRTLGKSLLE